MYSENLEGKVILVNGASRGIGEAFALAFAEQGAQVVVTSRNLESVEAVANAIRAKGGTALAVACHTGKQDQITALFERIQTECGRLDVLVNNAATNPYFGPFVSAPESAFDKTFEVNVKGYFLMAQQAALMMTKQEKGSIINIASIEGLSPSPMMSIYSMTKAAVIMLTKSLAVELGPANVRCNCICPGLTETRFAKVLIETDAIYKEQMARTPMGRHAQPEEIVGAALFLASDASSYTTGTVITCDGGSSI